MAPRSSESFEITDGVRIACPADRGLITPYVLREQGDWFEDEIRFLRALIAPDTVFIDIGANYGVYTLAVAKLAPRGHVWAYEPSVATAGYLTRGIELNGFDNVTLVRRALSDRAGTAWLSGRAAELKTLDAGTEDAEEVTLTTLDGEWRTHGWGRVDVVKIDVEGHEARVVEGGLEFFAGTSPLVMCEVRAGAAVDLEAPKRLAALGYRTFRVVPGLQALAPQDLDAAMDPAQLNVFCCKADRAAELHGLGRLIPEDAAAGAGRLGRPGGDGVASEGGGVGTRPGSGETGVTSAAGEAGAGREAGGAIGGAGAAREPGGAVGGAGAGLRTGLWREFLGSYAFGRVGIDAWNERLERTPLSGWDVYQRALDLYALAMDPGQSIVARYDALHTAYTTLVELLRTKGTLPRMATFARVAADYGARSQAVRVLEFLLDRLDGNTIGAFRHEPFLSPSTEFDTIEPTDALEQWALAASMAAFERLRTWSSCFSDPRLTIAMTDGLRKVGYLTPEMQRRAELARGRMG